MPEQDKVDIPLVVVPLRTTLVGDSVQLRPVEGEDTTESGTAPAKPLRLVIVMVEVPAEPDNMLTLVGLAATVKS